MKVAYTAFDKGGSATSGVIDAPSLHQAAEILRKRGLFVTESHEASANAATASGSAHLKPVGTGQRLKNLAMFARQLHVLIASGTQIVQALHAIERQCEHPGWRAVVERVRRRVEEGAPLSEAMAQQPQHFDAVCRSLIAAGESSGALPTMLERLATLARKQLHLRSSILGAMVYPCVLIGIGFIVMVVMIMFVLPRFEGLFESLDSPLPPTTQMLLWLSRFLWSYWWAVITGFIAAAVGFKVWIGSESGKQSINSAVLNAPKLGRLVRSLMTARLSRMLGTLLESRVALLDALQLTRHSAPIAQYADLLRTAENAVGRGEPMSSVLSNTDLISACVQEAIRNGESSGKLGEPLIQMADFLDEDNDVIVKSLTSIIEPMILIVLGLVVGLLAISMFLPLFDLVSAAQHG